MFGEQVNVFTAELSETGLVVLLSSACSSTLSN